MPLSEDTVTGGPPGRPAEPEDLLAVSGYVMDRQRQAHAAATGSAVTASNGPSIELF